MATNISKQTTKQPLHYVPRGNQIVKLPWDRLTTTEQESLRQAEKRAAYVQQFSIYSLSELA